MEEALKLVLTCVDADASNGSCMYAEGQLFIERGSPDIADELCRMILKKASAELYSAERDACKESLAGK